MVTDGVVETAVSGALGLVVAGVVAALALVLLFPKPRRKDTDAYVSWWP
jgi:hypothetical protein